MNRETKGPGKISQSRSNHKKKWQLCQCKQEKEGERKKQGEMQEEQEMEDARKEHGEREQQMNFLISREDEVKHSRSNQTLKSDGSWTNFFSHEEWANVESTETEGDEKICSTLFAFEPKRREKKWRESGQDSDKAKRSNSNSKGRQSGNANGKKEQREGNEKQQDKEKRLRHWAKVGKWQRQRNWKKEEGHVVDSSGKKLGVARPEEKNGKCVE